MQHRPTSMRSHGDRRRQTIHSTPRTLRAAKPSARSARPAPEGIQQ